MSKNILIIEDEVFISEYLKMILEDLGNAVCAVCASLKQFQELPDSVQPDFAFVDIRLNGKEEGIQIAEMLKNRNVPYAFVTSFSDKETLMNAILQKPFGYVLKPYTAEDIRIILDKSKTASDTDFIDLGNTQKLERVRIKDILWLKSDNVYVEVITKSNRLLLRDKLSEIHKKLPQNQFLRTNQSYVVNVYEVQSIETSKLIINNIEIPVSRKYRKEIVESL